MKLRVFVSSVPLSRLLNGLEALQSVLGELDRSADRRIAAEICLIRLCNLPYTDEPAVIRPIERRQETMKSPAPAQVSEPGNTSEPAQTHISGTHPEPDAHDPGTEAPPANAPSAPQAHRSWTELLKVLAKTMDSFLFGILRIQAHAEAELTGNTISIYAKSPFSMELIDTKDVKEAIKSAAEHCWERLFGKGHRVRSGRLRQKSKLESSAIRHIKFE
jgi:DNA polymerase III gamma/tau subunit